MLTNTEIDELFTHNNRRNKKYAGCFCKDELRGLGTPQEKIYIINLQNSTDGDGTHWVLLSNVNPNSVIYVDPFGVECPEEVLSFMKLARNPGNGRPKSVLESTYDFQDINSNDCGWFCVFIGKKLIKKVRFLRICSEFGLDTWKNEQLIRQFRARQYWKIHK